MRLLNSEPFGPLVKSSVDVKGKVVEVYHFDLPADETGIFNVAYRLATEPKAVEPPSVKDDLAAPEKMEAVEVDIPEEALEKARVTAAKLNCLGLVEVSIAEEVAGEVEKVEIRGEDASK